MPDDRDPELTTALETSGGRAVLRVRGEVDLFSAPEFAAALRAAAQAAPDVLVDLDEVEFMDSTGLRALLELRGEVAEAGGRLALALGDDGPVGRLIELAGVGRLFEREDPPPRKG